MSLSNSTIRAISQQPSQLIMSCTVEGVTTPECKKLIAQGGNQAFLGPEHGYCYTYNFVNTYTKLPKVESLDTVKHSGEHNGMELHLNFDGMYVELFLVSPLKESLLT